MSVDGDGVSGELDGLLSYIKDRRGFDFTGYKRGSLTRRIQKRLQEVKVATYGEYEQLLDSDPDEFVSLFNTILINVTGFLRDRDSWDYLEESILPIIAETTAQTGRPIRVWSAGCATGEEAISIAVVLLGIVGEERFKESVKIYATDVDDDALREARQARFSLRVLVDTFGEERVERYFERIDSSYMLRPDLRRSLIFARQDLVQDPPISRIDLLACRNTLMYFNVDVQQRILASFHFALNDDGYLFLGKSEALVTRTNLFAPVDSRQHVFVKQPRIPAPRPPLPAAPADRSPSIPPRPASTPLADAAFDVSVAAQIAVDRDGTVVLANRLARSMLGITLHQVGRPLRDLDVSFRPVELRSPIEEVLASRRPVTINEVEHRLFGGDLVYFDITIAPIERNGVVIGVTVSFQDVTRFHLLREELERSQRDLEMAYEELQSAVEELETTNEELQSTNEELETTNEELHSTNEELETMNEELQSTNEELETVNAELRQRTAAVDESNHFLFSILRSLHAGVAVLAADMTVRAWNREAEQLWGLTSDEVHGEHLLNLDIGLPVDELRVPIRNCLTGESAEERRTLTAVNRRGRTVQIDVTVTPLLGENSITGAILLMEETESETTLSSGDDHGGSTERT